MTLLIFILACLASANAAFHGDWHGAGALWIDAGVFMFVWYAVVDAGKSIAKHFPRENYNLTQNRYEFTESDDPTKPNENIPAIIEIGRREYGRKL